VQFEANGLLRGAERCGATRETVQSIEVFPAAALEKAECPLRVGNPTH